MKDNFEKKYDSIPNGQKGYTKAEIVTIAHWWNGKHGMRRIGHSLPQYLQ